MNYIKDKITKSFMDRFKNDDKYQSEETVYGEKGKHALSIIKNHVVWSMGAGFIPVPIADLFAVSVVQIDMIRQLSKVYGLDFRETEGKALITAITGSSIARLGARAVKFIPGVGTMIGGATMAVLSGASTYALGQVFKKHFETGGTFLDFDPKRVKKYYNEQFEKGKTQAENWRAEINEVDEIVKTPENKNENDSEIFMTQTERIQNQLKDLIKLKNEGVLNEEEYERLKSRILSEI